MRNAVGLCALVVTSGCGADIPVPKPSQLVPVEGSITIKGEPLEGALVIFSPSSSGGFLAHGYTDSRGHYTAETRNGDGIEPGAAPGSYQVMVSRMVKPDGTPLLDASEAPANVGAVESVPVQYSNPTESKLRAAVGQSGGTFDFNLK